MRLHKPCEHDRYEAHWMGQPETLEGVHCHGGIEPTEQELIEELERRDYLNAGRMPSAPMPNHRFATYWAEIPNSTR